MTILVRTSQFNNWIKTLNLRESLQVEARLVKIQYENHFGMTKKINEHLSELKWGNGRRVYFTFLNIDEEEVLVLLIGGNKNSQVKDISQANKLIKMLRNE